MKKILFTTLLLALVPLAMFAQTTVKGVIRDSQGPLVGVSILDKTTGKWTVTDIDGSFTLEEVKTGNIFEISCIGYNTASVAWKGENPFEYALTDDIQSLDEVVVIGYGAVKKKDLTGAVGIVDNSLIGQQSQAQLSQSLQGLIPGLTVTRSSSMPGSSATVKVRGVTTLSDNSPLILVDGVPASSLDMVAPEDVRQITVLKDAASASIYGARAAAGVILVTTKEASEGQLNIAYNGEASFITPTELPNYLTDANNYMTMMNEWAWNDGGNISGGDYAIYSKEEIANYAQNNLFDPITYPNFDWKNAILKDFSMRHKHNLSLTYGNKTVKTRVSASYENCDALYPGSNHERILSEHATA